jgi:hypothetical protein
MQALITNSFVLTCVAIDRSGSQCDCEERQTCSAQHEFISCTSCKECIVSSVACLVIILSKYMHIQGLMQMYGNAVKNYLVCSLLTLQWQHHYLHYIKFIFFL